MKTTVKVEGLREIQAALHELPKATAKNVMRRVLMKRSEPIAEAARRAAPARSGNLRDSIQVSTRSTGGDVGKRAFREVMQAGGSKGQARQALRDANRATSGSILVYIGPSQSGFHGLFQEFGTINHAPQPFMRPAWDATRDDLLPNIGDDMWAEIRKAAERRARKLAKGQGK